MARAPAQSDFSITRAPEIAPHAGELGGAAGAVVTRWIMRLTVVLLLALAVLCVVGLHIPAGE
jgi:hypothetical protein